MTAEARFLVGDVYARLAEIPDHSVDFLLCSPPFLALRSYLPAGHPDKAHEIGSEATPAEFLDTLLALTAEWGRVLAPHGSIAIELGDTYSGSGGAGWPLDKGLCFIPELYGACLAYGRNLLRAPLSGRELLAEARRWVARMADEGIELGVGDVLAYLEAILSDHEATGPTIEYEPWRVRTVKPWIRSNPPVGALGDKERPATSYVIVATRDRDRYFDLDAVRTAGVSAGRPVGHSNGRKGRDRDDVSKWDTELQHHPAGAPPRDWWHHVDAVLDAELDARAGKANGWSPGPTRTGKERAEDRGGNWSTFPEDGTPEARNLTVGARGVHLRRALERAGILTTLEAVDVSPKGYSGAHYAVWPPELVRLLVDEMCPRRVCTTCGQPSRRVVEAFTLDSYRSSSRPQTRRAVALADEHGLTDEHIAAIRAFGTSDAGKATVINHGAGHASDHVKRLADEAKAVLGGYFREFVQTTTAERSSSWSDCGHDTWRPGLVLDPFVGSGTTLVVATGMGRDAIGIDLDQRNAILALDRCGPLFLDIDWPPPNWRLLTLPPGRGAAAYEPWAHLSDISDSHAASNVLDLLASWCLPVERPELVGGRRSPQMAQVLDGQEALL